VIFCGKFLLLHEIAKLEMDRRQKNTLPPGFCEIDCELTKPHPVPIKPLKVGLVSVL